MTSGDINRSEPWSPGEQSPGGHAWPPHDAGVVAPVPQDGLVKTTPMASLPWSLLGILIAACTDAVVSFPLLVWPLRIGMAPYREDIPGPPSMAVVIVIAVLAALAGPVLGTVLCFVRRPVAR